MYTYFIIPKSTFLFTQNECIVELRICEPAKLFAPILFCCSTLISIAGVCNLGALTLLKSYGCSNWDRVHYINNCDAMPRHGTWDIEHLTTNFDMKTVSHTPYMKCVCVHHSVRHFHHFSCIPFYVILWGTVDVCIERQRKYSLHKVHFYSCFVTLLD